MDGIQVAGRRRAGSDRHVFVPQAADSRRLIRRRNRSRRARQHRHRRRVDHAGRLAIQGIEGRRRCRGIGQGDGFVAPAVETRRGIGDGKVRQRTCDGQDRRHVNRAAVGCRIDRVEIGGRRDRIPQEDPLGAKAADPGGRVGRRHVRRRSVNPVHAQCVDGPRGIRIDYVQGAGCRDRTRQDYIGAPQAADPGRHIAGCNRGGGTRQRRHRRRVDHAGRLLVQVVEGSGRDCSIRQRDGLVAKAADSGSGVGRRQVRQRTRQRRHRRRVDRSARRRIDGIQVAGDTNRPRQLHRLVAQAADPAGLIHRPNGRGRARHRRHRRGVDRAARRRMDGVQVAGRRRAGSDRHVFVPQAADSGGRIRRRNRSRRARQRRHRRRVDHAGGLAIQEIEGRRRCHGIGQGDGFVAPAVETGRGIGDGEVRERTCDRQDRRHVDRAAAGCRIDRVEIGGRRDRIPQEDPLVAKAADPGGRVCLRHVRRRSINPLDAQCVDGPRGVRID